MSFSGFITTMSTRTSFVVEPQFLQQVHDPRRRKERRHPLTAILTVIVATMMCRFDGYESAADLIRLLPIEVWHAFGGIRKQPCGNAFRKLMNKICPMQ